MTHNIQNLQINITSKTQKEDWEHNHSPGCLSDDVWRPCHELVKIFARCQQIPPTCPWFNHYRNQESPHKFVHKESMVMSGIASSFLILERLLIHWFTIDSPVVYWYIYCLSHWSLNARYHEQSPSTTRSCRGTLSPTRFPSFVESQAMASWTDSSRCWFLDEIWGEGYCLEIGIPSQLFIQLYIYIYLHIYICININRYSISIYIYTIIN